MNDCPNFLVGQDMLKRDVGCPRHSIFYDGKKLLNGKRSSQSFEAVTAHTSGFPFVQGLPFGELF
jgi:hypothetical protein